MDPERLAAAKVLCVGDVMLDRFVRGTVERISPEAPIPVLRAAEHSAMLGGAGNVARNIAALGARARLIAVVGADVAAAEVGQLVTDALDAGSRLLADSARPTTVKTRYIAGGQQLLRVDDEAAQPLAPALASALLAAVRGGLSWCDVVVLSDYAKGVLGEAVLAGVIEAAVHLRRPVLVDPKSRDFSRYRGATLLAPNRAELAAATGLAGEDDATTEAAARMATGAAGMAALIVTRGARGLSLLRSGEGALHLPALPRAEVYDVTGAGDTVMATLAVALAVGADLATAARLANRAGGIVVGKIGSAVVRRDELLAAEQRAAEAKIGARAEVLESVGRWRRRGERIGFTNGCFDLLHPGHVALLRQARAACDRLIVGLNSDESVRRLKGPGRPVQGEGARAAMLAAYAEVDAVVIFGESTPEALIEAIRPDVLVKGADYRLDEVVGGAFVRSYGGQVLLAELAPGHSTSATIARIAG
ncbi:MAG: D-glycero-beta-D-manno-heptose-7-phosphate kinase [Alphaproteobacteria bacterium]|nr:D-glycero-beta-D-manno-heptose-7-phosphate kinase [Alphaproteobacteria bacterium]